MKKNIAFEFRVLKKTLSEAQLPQDLKRRLIKELRYLERSCLLAAESSKILIVTFSRLAHLMNRHIENLPSAYISDFIQVVSSMAEQNEALKRDLKKLKASVH